MKNGPFVSTLFFAVGAWVEERRPRAALGAGVLLLIFGLLLHLAEAAFLHHQFGRPIMSNGYLLGTVPYALGVMFVALARPNFENVANRLGAASLGVFVFHPYVIEVFLLLPFGPTLSHYPLLLAALVLAVTFAVVLLAGKIRWLRSVAM